MATRKKIPYEVFDLVFPSSKEFRWFKVQASSHPEIYGAPIEGAGWRFPSDPREGRIAEALRAAEGRLVGELKKITPPKKPRAKRHRVKGRHVSMQNVRVSHRAKGQHAFAKGRRGVASSSDEAWAATLRNRARLETEAAEHANENKPAHVAALAHETAALAHEKAGKAQIPGSALAGIHRENARGHKQAASYLRQDAREEKRTVGMFAEEETSPAVGAGQGLLRFAGSEERIANAVRAILAKDPNSYDLTRDLTRAERDQMFDRLAKIRGERDLETSG
jgi:hypothetical protein